MNNFAVAGTCTAHQRQFIRILLDKLELSTDRFTCGHRVPFKAARLPEPPLDAPVDPHLRELSKAQGSALIRALKDQAGEEESDDYEGNSPFVKGALERNHRNGSR